MKTIAGSVVAAGVASACCLGPVIFSLVGAGALGAASVKLEPYRPWFLSLTALLLAAGFYTTYRGGSATGCAAGGACAPASRRTAKTLLWVATVAVVLLVTFPYYVNWLL